MSIPDVSELHTPEGRSSLTNLRETRVQAALRYRMAQEFIFRNGEDAPIVHDIFRIRGMTEPTLITFRRPDSTVHLLGIMGVGNAIILGQDDKLRKEKI